MQAVTEAEAGAEQQQYQAGTPCQVLWAVSRARNSGVDCQWCEAEFIDYRAATDCDYRVLIRGKTPLGNVMEVHAHPGSVHFEAEAA